MIRVENVIEGAMLLVGETSEYNDNSSSIYKLTASLLDGVASSIGHSEVYLFNAVEIQLNKISIDSNMFSKPKDFLSLISSTEPIQEVGEHFVSEAEAVTILYCKEMSMADMPSYLEDLMKYELGVKLAMSNVLYNDKINLLRGKLIEEQNKLIVNQAYDIEKWVPED